MPRPRQVVPVALTLQLPGEGPLPAQARAAARGGEPSNVVRAGATRGDRGVHRGRVPRRVHPRARNAAAAATPWLQAAQPPPAAEVMEAWAGRSLRWGWALGGLIGNTAVHFAHLAFSLGDRGPRRLAPVYALQPKPGAPTPSRAGPPAPPAGERAIEAEAAGRVVEFWRCVAADTAAAAEFQTIARRAGAPAERMGAPWA